MSRTLPLLPLRAVMFPAGLLHVTVTAAPALALLQRCHDDNGVFGVSWLQTMADGAHRPAEVGVVARLETLAAHEHGLRVSCLGRHRFRVDGQAERDDAGQWSCQARTLDDDAALTPDATMFPTVQALGRAIVSMRAGGEFSMRQPYRLDDAGWVANRWCELLPISLEAKQRLMMLMDPRARLALVDAYLREQRIVR